MARLVLALFLFAVLALAVSAALTLVRALTAPPAPATPPAREDAMPAAVRIVAYVVLLALLLGLTSGWIGSVRAR